jgi:hypothetical protein
VTGAWPWIALAGLGAFHGLNPAMGWLFAVALGLQRRRREAVLQSLLPIAAGHALSIAAVVLAVSALRLVVDLQALQVASAVLLIGFGLYRLLARHRGRFGMQVSAGQLVAWSFLMATAHGAGLMLLPALMPLCTGLPIFGEGSLLISLAAVGVHTLATLAVTGLVALLVHDWLGLAFLRRSWINFDLLWSGALVTTGLVLIATA